jgi:hypothetical protein
MLEADSIKGDCLDTRMRLKSAKVEGTTINMV